MNNHERMIILSFFLIQSVVGQSDIQSSDCNQNITDFLSICDAKQARRSLQGFQNQEDNSLALCCYDDDCCSRLDPIKDCLTCDLAETDEFNINLLQTLAYHATICQSDLQLPSCFMQQTQDQASQDRCAMQSFDLIAECGFLSQSVGQRENGFSCCWPTECCEKSQDLLSAECNSDCGTGQLTPLKTFGNIVARMWRKACLAAESLEVCSISQVMSATTPQPAVSQVPRIIQQDDDDFVEQQQEEKSIAVTSGDQCAEIAARGQSDDLKVVALNLQSFCADADQTDVLALQNLCCNAMLQVASIECEYYACASHPAQFFDPGVTKLVLEWISPESPAPFCPNTQNLLNTCDVTQALASDVVPARDSLDVRSALMSFPQDQLKMMQQSFFENFREQALENNLTTFQVFSKMPLFKEFYDELLALQLENRISGFPVTILGVNNTSLANVRKNVPQHFSSDWNRTILSHVVLGRWTSADLEDGIEQNLQTLAGYFINVLKTGEEENIIVQGCCTEQNFAIHAGNMRTEDGALWILDGSIYPPGVAEKVFNP